MLVRDQGYLSQSPRWCDQVAPGWREYPARVATFETMLFRDPPDHTRLRRLVSAAFLPRQAERMRADVTSLSRQALDELADSGSAGSTVNFAEFIAARLPIAVIGQLVGIPAADWPLLRRPMSALLRLVDLAVSRQAAAEADAAAVELDGYFRALAADRRRNPRPDLATAIVEAQHGEDPARAFTDTEIVQTLTFLFMAGVDTMASLLANGTYALLAHPQQAELARSGRYGADAIVDEVLRHDAPVQIVGRVAAADGVIGGVTGGAGGVVGGMTGGPDGVIGGADVRAGNLVLAVLGAGNRDPHRFPEPDAFDLTRQGTAPLSFGGGIHRCLGAPLARIEAGEFLTGLLTRFGSLRLAAEPERQGLVFRGFTNLPIALS